MEDFALFEGLADELHTPKHLEGAMLFVSRVMRGKLRFGRVPAALHSIRVGGALLEAELDLDTVLSGFLYRSYRERMFSLDELVAQFGVGQSDRLGICAGLDDEITLVRARALGGTQATHVLIAEACEDLAFAKLLSREEREPLFVRAKELVHIGTQISAVSEPLCKRLYGLLKTVERLKR